MFKDKTILVTGGCSGLGLAISQALHELSANVVVFDINEEKLSHISSTFDCYQVDVTNEDSVVHGVESLINKHTKIDVLINNAGIIHSKPLLNLTNMPIRHSFDDFKRIIDIDLTSVFLMTSVVAEKMLLNRIKGNIINISSISARGNSGQTAYSAAKAGVESMTKVWAKELGPFGIRSNAIAPGFINTESTQTAINKQIVKHVIDNTPLHTLGDVKNIAQAVTYLIQNEFVNGSILEVNGGLVI